MIKEVYKLAKLKVKVIRRALKEGSEIEKELSLDDWLLVRGIDKKLCEALEEAIDLCILMKKGGNEMTLDLRDMNDISEERFLAMLKKERTDVLNEADAVHEIEGRSDNEDRLRSYADILGDFIEQMER